MTTAAPIPAQPTQDTWASGRPALVSSARDACGAARRRAAVGLLAALLAVANAAQAGAEDQVEFLSGAKVQGVVKEIRSADREFDFEAQVAGRAYTRTYSFDKVHAVTMNGKRFVVTPLPAAAAAGSAAGKAKGKSRELSKAEIQRLIQASAAPPDWHETTPLDFPQTLDLTWPIKSPDKGWNNQKNVGQYLWDVVHPNPGRWKSGIKLIHHCATLHQDDPARLQRDMRTLGRMYFELLQDYPRAAFWLQQGKATSSEGVGVMLAECYWRMGSESMAREMLTARALPLDAIKLLGDMGDTQRAVQMADSVPAGPAQPQAQLLAADALRRAGRGKEAIVYYEKVINNPQHRNKEYERRFQTRAQDSIEAIRLEDRAQVAKVADGDHQGSSVGYNGRLDVSVTVEGGQIKAVRVTQHNEKQFYSALTDTPLQIIDTQRVTGLSATSRATITSQAIINATAKALASGAR